jgi:hypothetical protein
MLGAGSHMIVDDNGAALVPPDAHMLQAQASRVRSATRRHQQAIPEKGFAAYIEAKPLAEPLAAIAYLLHGGMGQHAHAFACERGSKLFADGRVGLRE